MKSISVFITVIIFMCAFCDHENNATLELVHVFFRHGSRTPDKHEIYPNDPYAVDDFYPIGYGQLTNNGKHRAYRLGKLLRKRYKNFLGDIYMPETVWAQTTDFDRTKMSAQLLLAALFPPSPMQKWDSGLSWMPIPYHYEKTTHDYELRRPNAYCPAYMKELQNVLASSVLQNFIKEHMTTFQYVSEHSGKNIDNLIDMFSMFQVLHSEKSMNLTLPDWTSRIYPESIRYLAAQQCFFENYTPILKRLNGGRMLKKVVENMLRKSEGTLQPSGRKIYLYSAHDNNVINILSALRLFEPHFPEYSAAVMIELYSVNATNHYFVKVVYAKDVDIDPEEQLLPKCSTFCPLDQFLEITEPYLPVNYTKECESTVFLN